MFDINSLLAKYRDLVNSDATLELMLSNTLSECDDWFVAGFNDSYCIPGFTEDETSFILDYQP